MMQKRFRDEILLGSVTLVIAGTISLFMPSRSGAALAGGTVGAVGVVIAIKQQNKRFSAQMRQVRQEFSGSLTQAEHQLAATQAEMVALRQQLKQQQSQQSEGNSSIQAEMVALRQQLKQQQSQQSEGNSSIQAEMVALRQQLNQLHKSEGNSSSPVTPDSGSKSSPIPIKGVITHEVDSEPESVQEAIAYFAAHEVNVNSYRQPKPDVDAIFDSLAVYLGERYTSLAVLHREMKRSIITGSRFRFSMLDRSQQDITNCTQFCSKLNDYSLLSFYNYSRSERLIQGTLQRRGDVINFLNGEWFERFLYRQVSNVLISRGLSYECLMNPKVIFPNGDRFELDLFFIIKGQPLWIECKTGNNYNAYLERYSNHRKILAVPKERSLLVIFDIPESQTTTLTNLWDITVANKDNFVQLINAALNSSESQENQQIRHPNITIFPHRELSTLFSKINLRPIPEYRGIVINELLKVLEELAQPMTLIQIKRVLVERLAVPTQISNIKLHEILQAIVQSTCLFDGNGKPISSFNEPVSSLVSSNPDILENKCVERYAAAVLKFYPNYFNNPQNVQQFEQTVGGKAPDAKTIEQLKNNLRTPLPELPWDLNIEDEVA